MINLHVKLQNSHSNNNNNNQAASDNNNNNNKKQCNIINFNNNNISPRSSSASMSIVTSNLVSTTPHTNYAISSPGSLKMSLRNKSTSEIVDYNQYYTNSSSSCSFNTNGNHNHNHSHNHSQSMNEEDEFVCDERRHSPSDDYLVTSDDIEKFNKLKSEDLNIENAKWLENKPISVLHLDQPDRAVLKIAGNLY